MRAIWRKSCLDEMAKAPAGVKGEKMEHKGTLIIETERLILRRFTPSDAEAGYRNWMSSENVTKYLTWSTHTSPDVSAEIVKSWAESYNDPTFYLWAIVLKEINEPIGSISCVDMNEKVGEIEIGYCIGESWWHKGYVSEAFSAVIAFMFDEVKALRVEARHDPNNPNSGKVMQKCGLTYEGTIRQTDMNNQGIVDSAVYGILKDEYYNGL